MFPMAFNSSVVRAGEISIVLLLLFELEKCPAVSKGKVPQPWLLHSPEVLAFLWTSSVSLFHIKKIHKFVPMFLNVQNGHFENLNVTGEWATPHGSPAQTASWDPVTIFTFCLCSKQNWWQNWASGLWNVSHHGRGCGSAKGRQGAFFKIRSSQKLK